MPGAAEPPPAPGSLCQPSAAAGLVSPPPSVALLSPAPSLSHPSPVPVPMPWLRACTCGLPCRQQRWELRCSPVLHLQHLLPQLSFPLGLFRNPENRDTIIRSSSSDKVWHKQCPGWETKEPWGGARTPNLLWLLSAPGGPGPLGGTLARHSTASSVPPMASPEQRLAGRVWNPIAVFSHTSFCPKCNFFSPYCRAHLE